MPLRFQSPTITEKLITEQTLIAAMIDTFAVGVSQD